MSMRKIKCKNMDIHGSISLWKSSSCIQIKCVKTWPGLNVRQVHFLPQSKKLQGKQTDSSDEIPFKDHLIIQWSDNILKKNVRIPLQIFFYQ